MIGESAGGHHVASSMIDIKDLMSIKGMVLIYPEIEYGGENYTESEIAHANVNGILSAQQDAWYFPMYYNTQPSF